MKQKEWQKQVTRNTRRNNAPRASQTARSRLAGAGITCEVGARKGIQPSGSNQKSKQGHRDFFYAWEAVYARTQQATIIRPNNAPRAAQSARSGCQDHQNHLRSVREGKNETMCSNKTNSTEFARLMKGGGLCTRTTSKPPSPAETTHLARPEQRARGTTGAGTTCETGVRVRGSQRIVNNLVSKIRAQCRPRGGGVEGRGPHTQPTSDENTFLCRPGRTEVHS